MAYVIVLTKYVDNVSTNVRVTHNLSSSSVSRATILNWGSIWYDQSLYDDYSIRNYSTWINYDNFYGTYEDLSSTQTNYFNINFTTKYIPPSYTYTVRVWKYVDGVSQLSSFDLTVSSDSISRSSVLTAARNQWYNSSLYSDYSVLNYSSWISYDPYYQTYDNLSASSVNHINVNFTSIQHSYNYYVEIYTASGSSGYSYYYDEAWSGDAYPTSYVYLSNLYSGYTGYDFEYAYVNGSYTTTNRVNLTLDENTTIKIYLRYPLYYYRYSIVIGGSTVSSDGPFSSTSSTVSVRSLYNSYASSYVFLRAESSADYIDYSISDSVGISSSKNSSSSAITITLYCRRSSYPYTVYAYIGDNGNDAYQLYQNRDYDYYASSTLTGGETISISNTLIKAINDKYSEAMLTNYNYYSGYYLTGSYTVDQTITLTSGTSNEIHLLFTKIPRYYTVQVYIDNVAQYSTAQSHTTYTASLAPAGLREYTNYAEDSRYEFLHVYDDYSESNNPITTPISLIANGTVNIKLYFKTLAVTPTIELVSATATTVTVKWGKNGGSSGQWYILYGTSPTVYGTSAQKSVSVPGDITITGLTYRSEYFISCINVVGNSTAKSADIHLPAGGSGGVGGGSGRDIHHFSWTANDDTYIRPGKAVTNLKASAWNELIAKINELRSVYGMGSSGLTNVGAGDPITKARFNSMRDALAQVPGVGTVVPSVGDGYQVIKARYFHAQSIDDFGSLKQAINRAVDSANT